MSGRWWRAYDEAVDDPKLCLLSDRAHRAWFNLCCITSQNGGRLPSIEAIAFKLRMPTAKTRAIVDELVFAGLIDRDETGSMAPHNWGGRQFQSDGSTSRVKRFRERQRNVSPAVSETAPDTDTDTDTDTEKKDIRAVATATRPDTGKFSDFWQAYPKRDGANPKAPAEKKFYAAVRSGADPDEIVSAVVRYADECRAKGHVGTAYVAQAMTWINQRRWIDYPAAPETPEPSTAPIGWKPGMRTREEILEQERKAREARAINRPDDSGDSRPAVAEIPRARTGLPEGPIGNGPRQADGAAQHAGRPGSPRDVADLF